MRQRVITGVLGGAGFLILLWIGAWGYVSLVAVLATLGYFEFTRMKRISFMSLRSLIGLLLIWCLLLQSFGVLDWTWSKSDTVLAGMLVFLMLMVTSRNRVDVDEIAYLFLGSLYIGYGFSFMIHARMIDNGLAWSLLAIMVTFANDTGAYFSGRQWGKRKLWPSVSPNKTWEGSLGGILFSLVVAGVIAVCFPELGSFVAVIGIGLLISLTGQFGDLIESAIKRKTGVKDTGTLLPGHGGVLDRFDSLLFVFPVLHLIQLI